MKRLILIFFALVFITSLFGCTSYVKRYSITRHKKAYLTFFNPSIHIGRVSIEPLSSNEFTPRVSKSKNMNTTTHNYKLQESRAKNIHLQLEPGGIKRLLLKPGYYLISMSTNKGHRIKIQAADGRIYSMHGHIMGSVIRLPKAANEPGYGSFELDVINN
ncbi:MAG: hypothetical protein U5L76_00765 [Patescibacteria group bacterium]|nr:hypothetical protein [Patescibacteria group bacterium]